MVKLAGRWTIRENEDTGEVGFCPEWMEENGEPMWGRAVAHDLLEHGGEGDGSIADEIQAVAAAYALRWETGAIFDHYRGGDRAPDALANDFLEMFRYFSAHGLAIENPGDVPELNCDGVERDFSEAIEKIGAGIVAEGYAEHDADNVREFLSAESRRRFLGWLRVGYRRAEERFEGAACRYSLYSETFRAIEVSADLLLHSGTCGEDETPLEGCTLVVECDTATGEVSMAVRVPMRECYACGGCCECAQECPDCEGVGYLDCSNCAGEDCSNCAGDEFIDCKECNGEAERPQECPDCDGEGMISPLEPVRLYGAREGAEAMARIHRGY